MYNRVIDVVMGAGNESNPHVSVMLKKDILQKKSIVAINLDF